MTRSTAVLAAAQVLADARARMAALTPEQAAAEAHQPGDEHPTPATRAA